MLGQERGKDGNGAGGTRHGRRKTDPYLFKIFPYEQIPPLIFLPPSKIPPPETWALCKGREIKGRRETTNNFFFLLVNMLGVERGSSGSCNYSPVDAGNVLVFFYSCSSSLNDGKTWSSAISASSLDRAGKKVVKYHFGVFLGKSCFHSRSLLSWKHCENTYPSTVLCGIKVHRVLDLKPRSKNWVLPKSCL